MCKVQLIPHTCPVCENPIFGSRSDKIFCNIKCKNEHHAYQRRLHKYPESENFKHRRRNFVILDGTLGFKHTIFETKLSSLEHFGFHLNHCDEEPISEVEKSLRGVSKLYYLLDFKLEVLDKNILRVTRENPVIRDIQYLEDCEVRQGFYRRWLIEFPEQRDGERKASVLAKNGVWRE